MRLKTILLANKHKSMIMDACSKEVLTVKQMAKLINVSDGQAYNLIKDLIKDKYLSVIKVKEYNFYIYYYKSAKDYVGKSEEELTRMYKQQEYPNNFFNPFQIKKLPTGTLKQHSPLDHIDYSYQNTRKERKVYVATTFSLYDGAAL
jgi:hypothetical protein